MEHLLHQLIWIVILPEEVISFGFQNVIVENQQSGGNKSKNISRNLFESRIYRLYVYIHIDLHIGMHAQLICHCRDDDRMFTQFPF